MAAISGRAIPANQAMYFPLSTGRSPTSFPVWPFMANRKFLPFHFVLSIQNRDYTMISGTTIFYGAFLIFANLVVDLVYGIIDPRVKLEEG